MKVLIPTFSNQLKLFWALIFIVFVFTNAISQEHDEVKKQLFFDIEEMLNRAEEESVPFLVPKNFAKAYQFYQRALSDYEKGERLNKIRENMHHTEIQLGVAFETAKISRAALERTLHVHTEVIGSAANKLVAGRANPDYFSHKFLTERDFIEEQSYQIPKAEKKLKEAMIKIEEGNINAARSLASKAEREYRASVVQITENDLFAETRAYLNETKQNMPEELFKSANVELNELQKLFEEQAMSEMPVADISSEVNLKVQNLLTSIGIERDPDLMKQITPSDMGTGLISWNKNKLVQKFTIDEKYQQHGGRQGFLGPPKGGEQSAANGGKVRHYKNGSIYWHSSSGAFEVHGAILAKYNELSAEKGFLGYPFSDELKVEDNIGRYQMFNGGTILWTPLTGAHEMHGEIFDKYKALGAYNSFLGYPRTDTYWSPNEKPWWKFWNMTIIIDWLAQEFMHPKSQQESTIFWTENHGAHEVHGDIRKKWKQVGYDWSTGEPVLGSPKTDELKTPDGKGRFNHFTNASIYWTPATGAHFVRGKIYQKWQALNWEKGILGYPKTDEMTTPGGEGKYNHFENGSIYWSSNSGAHEVHGEILKRWAQLGWEKSYLGFPHTDVKITPNGKGEYANFYGGGIVWYSGTGAKDHKWFDKLTVYMGESIYMNASDPAQIWISGQPQSRDNDGDLIKDDMEGKLAESLSPYYKFDSDESFRRSFEPVTLFQARPYGCSGDNCSGKTEIWIKWAFLFQKDGGYGPHAWACPENSDPHWGDNDQALYKLASIDGGFTWELQTIMLAPWHKYPITWPAGYQNPAGAKKRLVPGWVKTNLERYNKRHPVIYFSSHKHHMYFDTSNNHKDSYYSNVPGWDDCDDDVNGGGVALLSDVRSVFNDYRYNNVGEPGKNSGKYFVNCMSQFPGGQYSCIGSRTICVFNGDKGCNNCYSAWGDNQFYEVGANKNIWMTNTDCKYWTNVITKK